ncbi:MAG: type II toxin-antitoxin system RelE/ParE family toxin [Desulfobaccales bacterium]
MWPRRFIFSFLAESNLEEMGDYIARDNPARAISFNQGIRDRCRKITASPEAAPLRPELGEGVRLVPFGRYLIFYTVRPESIRVERVLHSARNISGLFDA